MVQLETDEFESDEHRYTSGSNSLEAHSEIERDRNFGASFGSVYEINRQSVGAEFEYWRNREKGATTLHRFPAAEA
ncbi:MAG: hypothetical protein ACLRMJ_00935 [Alistipes finegoldii]